MTVIRHYLMVATDGRADDLRDSLRALAATAVRIAGCESIDVSQDSDRGERFLFIERWASRDAHKQGGALLPRHLMAAVMALLAAPPEAGWFSPL